MINLQNKMAVKVTKKVKYAIALYQQGVHLTMPPYYYIWMYVCRCL